MAAVLVLLLCLQLLAVSANIGGHSHMHEQVFRLFCWVLTTYVKHDSVTQHVHPCLCTQDGEVIWQLPQHSYEKD